MPLEHLPYRVGVGHDLDIGDTDIILQQPRAEPAEPVEVQYGIDASHHYQHEYICFIFDVIESYDLYVAILGQFDLDSNQTSEVTIYGRSRRLSWNKFNGIAHLPIPGEDYKWDRFFLRDVRIYVTDLEPIA